MDEQARRWFDQAYAEQALRLTTDAMGLIEQEILTAQSADSEDENAEDDTDGS
jgi:hypothetical protein